MVPLLGAVAALHFASWLFEVLVGTLYALAAHTALTRLRIRMFRNLVQQDGELSPIPPALPSDALVSHPAVSI